MWQAGRLQAIEVTTELPEYWEALAGEDPARVLDLVAAFAGAASVPTASVFGEFDPFAATATPQQRAAAFRSQMFPSEDHRHPGPTSELNNGHAAITCMIHPDNNLSSLLRLVVSSCRPYLVRDSVTERPRFPSGSEAIIGIGANAVDGRNSDTLAVERLVRFATERRYIELADPIGIFICDVQHHELVQPDGSDVPVDWFKLSRGASSADGKPRYRRLRLEAPREAGLWLDELTIRRTEECLHYGGQLAELVQLALYVRTSASAGLADIDPADPSTSTPDCSSVLENWQEFRDSRDGLADR